jgi:hypothetical protein
MNFINKFSFHTLLSVLLFGTLLLAGCSNPAGNDDNDHEEHPEAFGMELIMNGETLVRYFDGEASNRINIEAGEETSLITARFLDEDGERIEEEYLDDETSLGWEVEDEEVLEVEQHDDDGKWNFHLMGVSSGTTKIKFQLLHGEGSSAHPDFETPDFDSENAIEVQVE